MCDGGAGGGLAREVAETPALGAGIGSVKEKAFAVRSPGDAVALCAAGGWDQDYAGIPILVNPAVQGEPASIGGDCRGLIDHSASSVSMSVFVLLSRSIRRRGWIGIRRGNRASKRLR